MVGKATVFISGNLSWVKVLGEPSPNFNKDGREWTFEIEPDEAGLQQIIRHGLTDRIKGQGYNIGTKGQHKERKPFLIFKKTEFNKQGQPNKPIRVYDADDVAWDPMLNAQGQVTNLIGNNSKGDVKLDIRDYGPGKKKGIYPVAIRVTDHVEYASSEFGAMDGVEDQQAPAAKGNRKKKQQDDFAKDFGLEDPAMDDEIPF